MGGSRKGVDDYGSAPKSRVLGISGHPIWVICLPLRLPPKSSNSNNRNDEHPNQIVIVMPSNNSGKDAWKLFREFPGRLAHLQSAASMRDPKFGHHWALDNGVFGAFTAGIEWNEKPFYDWLDKHADKEPMWAVVPDSVGDRVNTLRMWQEHAPRVASYGVPLAFAAQDGMTIDDVPDAAEVIFVGGSTAWKWRNLRMWTDNFPRVHVGRVNTYRLLWMAHDAGADSCDGTGFFRGDQKQLDGLRRYLSESTTNHRPQLCLTL